MARRAHRLGVPLRSPPTHPFNPLLALRVATAAQTQEEQLLLIDALFAAAWGRGTGIESAELVSSLIQNVGLDAERILHDANAPDTKALLRQRTEEAVAAGVFGVPTMIIGNELFWGADALEPMEGFLRGEDPLQQNDLERWLKTVPSASRR